MNQPQMIPLLVLLLGLGIHIVVETIILTIALFIMIKLQKLNYNFLGLLGTAGLASALDVILDLVFGYFLGGYLGTYLSTPIVVIVLFICIAKLTEADPVDVTFTIVVGYAVYFVLNLWLFAAFMPSLSHDEEDTGTAALGAEYQSEYESPRTNRPAIAIPPTNPPAGKITPPAKAPDTIGTAAISNGPAPVSPAKVPVKGFSLKGIIGGAKPSAAINTGVKTYTLFEGDTLTMETAQGKVDVRCDKLETNKVLLDISGEPVTLLLPAARR
jgi:hypothetical protein